MVWQYYTLFIYTQFSSLYTQLFDTEETCTSPHSQQCITPLWGLIILVGRAVRKCICIWLGTSCNREEVWSQFYCSFATAWCRFLQGSAKSWHTFSPKAITKGAESNSWKENGFTYKYGMACSSFLIAWKWLGEKAIHEIYMPWKNPAIRYI